MTIEEFKVQYDSGYRCIGYYRDASGWRLSGVVLDVVQKSVGGVDFVWINNFATRIPLSQLERVEKTSKL